MRGGILNHLKCLEVDTAFHLSEHQFISLTLTHCQELHSDKFSASFISSQVTFFVHFIQIPYILAMFFKHNNGIFINTLCKIAIS